MVSPIHFSMLRISFGKRNRILLSPLKPRRRTIIAPRHFTFDLCDIAKAHSTLLVTIHFPKWTEFPSPKVRILNRDELYRRVFRKSNPLYRRWFN